MLFKDTGFRIMEIRENIACQQESIDLSSRSYLEQHLQCDQFYND